MPSTRGASHEAARAAMTTGAILWVDLTAATSRVEPLTEAALRGSPGGALLAGELLLAHTRPGLDAFDPEALLVFAGGAATGVRTIALPQMSLVGKSPLSGVAADSCVEGPFGPALRDAGYTAIAVHGQCAGPSYLLIENGAAQLLDAEWFAGLDTAEKTTALRERHGATAHIATIGVAGERLVRFASVVTDGGFTAARGGLGAVLGAKKLLAVVLAQDGAPEDTAPSISRIAIYDAAAASAIHALYRSRIPNNPLTTTEYEPPGFGAWPGEGQEGYLGIENYRTAQAGDWSAFAADAYRARLQRSAGGCPGCPQDCLKTFRSKAAGQRERELVLHQEAVAAFAANLGVRDLDAVLDLAARCTLWGVDPVSLSYTISAFIDASQSGALREDMAAPNFGDAAAITSLCEAIAHRNGVGNWLAEGSARASEQRPELGPFALHIRGVEIGGFDPRGSHAQALVSLASPTGPAYAIVEHDIDFDPVWGRQLFRDQAAEFGCPPEGYPMASLSDDKVRFTARLWELWSALNALGVCVFAAPPTRALSASDVLDLVRAATGWTVHREELFSWGRRRLAVLNAYAERESRTAVSATMPARFFERPIDAGRLAGAVLNREAMADALVLLRHEVGL